VAKRITAKELESGTNLLFGGSVYYVVKAEVELGTVTVFVRERGAKPFHFGLNQMVSVEE
jgi:hypothetical protein